VSATGELFESRSARLLASQPGWKKCGCMTPVVDARLSRYRGLLRFMAARVLGGSEGVEEAVRNCLLAAACDPPRFETEGALRSWLLRLLIGEALQVLYRQKKTSEPILEPVLSEVR
jgi:DNA-directed RNA polymerase specialized sigma24 family protein